MLNIAVCVSGGGTDLQSIIDACEAGKINGQIRLVISNRKKAYGLERARLHGIQAEWIKDEDEILKRFEEEKIDVVVLAGYLAIVGDKLIKQYKNRIINIHPSLIPSFCGPGFYGMHVHEAVFKRGVKVSGATVHFVTGEVDGGPIILQRAVDISDLETPEDIQARVLEIEHEILPEAVALYCEGRVSVENERVKIS
ncbi:MULTISPECIES: phosphoribosylglycinamide formyltransferase [Catenibacterium]|uniref:Phosphoribosylglycinamide formyltransferase n=1 Tax=Catenibacterium mitsuokai TaxID=100886 RepID=A0AAW4MQU5_9FIRM|nr:MULTISPECIES: phosphoribosylglycinamide formyltransferase [Catenibacterium]MBV3366325.1 phosphoribosylglycinamide formyltransferase [Catenibacterium mitsuokai]MBV3370461.1 phosphoribosylglycinamide formyltransferase [Catenibacterium mitsuokai]MBV3375754.1 phosphoribosylglycinamide formyltransferase [Catenibacterium mitsuokai]MBV3378386.1 phosphoribosylglycinamide formyltransferase [Catenibacterium mitsuokai]MBV3380285.1 phosphoribosylglycinamide formyltransferase [Catenibacterium mitsuokai]